MKKNILIAIVALGSLFMGTSCRDQFADINTNPSDIVTGPPQYLFTRGVIKFEPSFYQYWFYSAPQFFSLTQLGMPSGSIGTTYNDGKTFNGFKSIETLKYRNAITYEMSQMSPEQAEAYKSYEAAMNVLCIYMGIYDSDFIGEIPYVEAAMAAWGGTLAPEYDAVEDLYDMWLTQLQDNIETLTANNSLDVMNAAQDIVYEGNKSRWATLANSIKLKIAVRLLNTDKAKAIAIVEEVVNNPVGYIDSAEENLLFNKATSSPSDNDYPYGFNDNVMESVAGTKTFIDFMVKNKDPRVRFIFTKNSWNSQVVQAFLTKLDENKPDYKGKIPSYIMENVVTEVVDGKTKFKEWGGPGEPWVRYYGLPQEFNASTDGKYADYFNSSYFQLNDDYSYNPTSRFNQQMVRGRASYTYPNVPGTSYVEPARIQPWWGMYMTAAEVNLYLAEFKLLGANLPESASDYFERAVRFSVSEYGFLAEKNAINYTSGTAFIFFDDNAPVKEEPINLKNGEIDALLQQSDYQLTGNLVDDLEKIYLQQIFHFQLQPIDMFMTSLRSGIPKNQSSLFQRYQYDANSIPNEILPRRVVLGDPVETSLMYENQKKSYARQGFTPGGGAILNTQRIWIDKTAPQFGEGPKYAN